MSSTPSASTPATATAAAPATLSRGTHRGGGRGVGRGGFLHRGGRGDSRGRGRGEGGGDRGRGRGFNDRQHHRGGRGGSGGRGYVPKKAMRHRSLSGKHGTHAGHDSREPAAKREKKDQKPNSNFALLHSMLGDAAMIAEYIREYHSSEKFRDAKSVNTFLQAISQRPETVYAELMANYKDEVFTTLERLFAVYALGRQSMIPPAHEFLIRCEQAGVRKAAWADSVKTLPAKKPETEEEHAEGNAGTDTATAAASSASSPAPSPSSAPTLPAEATSLLSPRELLKKLSALDPVGRLQRLIELSDTVEDVQVCAKKLAVLLSDTDGPDSGSGNGNTVNNTGERFDFVAKCQLISKLLSKARRVVEPAFAPTKEAANEKKAGHYAKEEGKEDEEEATSRETALGGRADGGIAAAEAKSASPADSNAVAESEVDASAAATSLRRRREPLTEEEIEAFHSTLSLALRTLECVLRNRPPNMPQQPLSKFSKLLEWCKIHGLLASEDEHFIAMLAQEAEKDLVEQATQLEAVITLKSLTAGDTAALTQVVNQLWRAGDEKCFAPSSVDVLSAIAVAASAASIEAATKRLIADRLVQTQRYLADKVVLPRRALRFVNEERNKVKQAAIAKQLKDDAAQFKTEGSGEQPKESGEEEEEEEDMALEEA
jgi:hypothetical protein